MLSYILVSLVLDSDFPGIIFFNKFNACVTSNGVELSHAEEAGIVLSVPEQALTASVEPLELSVRPCFTGPFKLPEEYESASPAYLIHPSKRVGFQKKVTLRIQHYARLQSEEDCEKMTFLSASSTPKCVDGSSPVYTFKEIESAKGVFRPGDHQGEIALSHFCMVKVATKRSRDHDEDSQKKHGGLFLKCAICASYNYYYVKINSN